MRHFWITRSTELCYWMVATSFFSPQLLSAQGWSWLNPLPQGNTLNAVRALSESIAVAVGTVETFLRTTDGGNSWSVQSHIGETANDLTGVDFTSADTGWVVGSNGTILKTTDGGTSWVRQTGGTSNYLRSVYFPTSSTGWAVGQFGTIVHTTDAGEHWISQMSGVGFDLWSVSFANSEVGWAVGDFATVVNTTNGGTTWISHVLGSGADYTCVYFDDLMNGWIASGSTLHTTDAGITWLPQEGGGRVVHFVDSLNGWGVGYGGIQYTTDGGETWSDQTSPVSTLLESISFANTSVGWAVGDFGAILHTIDGGTNWTAQSSAPVPNSPYGVLYGVFFADSNVGWTVKGGEILATTTGGAEWISQQLSSSPLWDVRFVDSATGWATGDGGLIFKTTDGGLTWNTQSSGVMNGLYAGFFADRDLGWIVGGGGTILHTTNGGSVWSEQQSGTDYLLSGIHFTNSNSGWVAGSDGGPPFNGQVLHTNDGGASWDVQLELSSTQLYSVWFVDANIGWVAGEGGMIWNTTDGGLTWIEQPSRATNSVSTIQFIDPNNGWTIGSTGEIQKTSDGGARWIKQGSGTIRDLESSFFIDANTGWAVGDANTVLHTTTGGTGIDPPPSPLPVYPPDGSIVTSRLILDWESSGDAQWYSLQVSTNPFFVTYELNKTEIESTAFQIKDLQEGTIYYWRVSQTGKTGTSNWSEVWNFATLNIPDRVILLSPEDGSVITTDSTVLAWHPVFPSADRYWLEGDEDSTFASPFVDSLLIDTVRTVSFLQHNETYWWKARAHNSYGWGQFSEVRSFFVYREIPPPPLLLSPPNGAVGVSTSPTVSWTPSVGSESYAIEVSDTIDFSHLIVQASQIGTTSFLVSDLESGSTYYWRVSASNDLGTSDWSEVWSFTTTIEIPSQVILQSPENGSAFPPLPTTFFWNEAQPGIDAYWFELAIDSLFTLSAIDSSLTDTTTVVTEFKGNQTYWWRVRGRNAIGWGSFSEAWSFTTFVTGVDEPEIPREFSLSQNYPNPFNPTTAISYQLPAISFVRLQIYDLLGREVATLVEGIQEPGYRMVEWDANGVPSGVYFYRLSAGSFVETKKLIVLQ